MPLIDVRCLTCGEIREVMRPLAMHPATPPCRCGAATEQIHLPKAVSWTVDPVVVFQAADGSFRFPGDRHGLSAANYRKQGLKEVEIRGAVEMRRFEGVMNRHEYARAELKVEIQQRQREARESVMRSGLRQQMQSMSAMGRAVARVAMDRNDAKPIRVHAPGFHSEVFSYDSSNREASRDAQGRRRRD